MHMNGTERTHQGQTMTRPNLAAIIQAAMTQLITHHEAAREIITKANPKIAQRFIAGIARTFDLHDDTNATTGLLAMAVAAGTIIAAVTPPDDYENLATGMSSLIQTVARNRVEHTD
jgi:hypothetical protein